MTLEALRPLVSAIGSAETNDRGWNALSASLPEDGRCTLPLREFNFHPLGSWLARERGPLLFGAKGLLHGLSAVDGKRKCRIKTVS